METVDLATVADAVAKTRLICCGGFHPREESGVLLPANMLVLIGNAGPAMWRTFHRQISERNRRRCSHPLDAWTRRALTDAARRLGAKPLFPFDGPPFHPFSTWSQNPLDPMSD